MKIVQWCNIVAAQMCGILPCAPHRSQNLLLEIARRVVCRDLLFNAHVFPSCCVYKTSTENPSEINRDHLTFYSDEPIGVEDSNYLHCAQFAIYASGHGGILTPAVASGYELSCMSRGLQLFVVCTLCGAIGVAFAQESDDIETPRHKA